MIAHLMIYCTATSLLISIGGLALDRVAAWFGWQRRSIWAFALGAAIMIPAVRMISSQEAPTFPPYAKTTLTGVSAADTRAVTRGYSISLKLEPQRVVVSDKALRLAWAITSASLVTFYLLVAARLWWNARQWQPLNIDGRKVWVTDAVGPAVYGFFRPRILLPRWMTDGPAEPLALVLDHEQEHVRAHDNWLLLLGLMVVASAPWNIPLWWQFRRLRFAIEVDCDARVMARGADPEMYGRALLRIAEQRSHIPVAAMGLTEPASQLLRRVRIMTTSRPRRNIWVVCGVLSSSLACVTVAAQLEPPTAPVSAASNNPQVPIAGEDHLEAEQMRFVDGCDPYTGRPVQSVLVLSGKHVLGHWSGSSTDVRTFVLPNGFHLGLKVEPASADVYARYAKAIQAKYVPELVQITLFDMSAAVPRKITQTFGGVTSIQGYSPYGGADRVVEVGEPGITLMLNKQACVVAPEGSVPVVLAAHLSDSSRLLLEQLRSERQGILKDSSRAPAKKPSIDLSPLIGIDRRDIVGALGAPDSCATPDESDCGRSSHVASFFFQPFSIKSTANRVTAVTLPIGGWALAINLANDSVANASWAKQE